MTVGELQNEARTLSRAERAQLVAQLIAIDDELDPVYLQRLPDAIDDPRENWVNLKDLDAALAD